jgi:hypothetical protein
VHVDPGTMLVAFALSGAVLLIADAFLSRGVAIAAASVAAVSLAWFMHELQRR